MPKLRIYITAPLLALALAASSVAPSGATRPRARTAANYKTGVGNESSKMFHNTYWTRLHTKIVRYIAPYDAAVKPYSMEQAIRFITAAEAAHQEVVVAFYHSEYSPTRLPGVAQYRHDVQKFIKRFPHVRQYQAWDETNRGDVPHAFSSPSAELDARYYQALIRVCHGCTAIGLDVLDATYIQPTLRYISEFKHEIGKLKTIMPRIWGLHNYADLNTLSGARTPIIVRALGGEVWLTETGGIVKFADTFTNVHGSGLTRAVKVLNLMFRVAQRLPQIKRLYIYDWTGGTQKTRFDAGLMNSHEQPRPGYNVVCHALHASRCATHLSKT
jgi:hypothetical protein